MNPLLLIFLAALPTVVHPVKNEATHEMLRAIATEPDPVVQREARDALALIESGVTPAPPAAPPLPVALLEHPAVILDRMSPAEIRARAAWVTEQLAATEAATREAALLAALRGELSAATPAMLPSLEHADEGVRQATGEALAGLAPRTADILAVVTALGRRLEREPSTIAAASLGGALVAVGPATAQTTVIALLEHDRALARLTAVRVVAGWGEPALAPRLYPRLRDADDAVAATAAEALGTLQNPAADGPLLARLVEQPLPIVAEQIARALGVLRSRAAVAALAGLVNEAPDNVSAAAAEALGRIGDPAALPALRRPVLSLKPVLSATRREAIKALRLFGDLEPRAGVWRVLATKIIPTPMGPVYDRSENREEALRYFAATQDRRVVASLLELFAAEDGQALAGVYGETFRTLAALGDEQTAREMLTRLITTPAAAERVALTEALRALTGRAYRALPDQDYRRYSVESLSPAPFSFTPAPPGVEPVD